MKTEGEVRLTPSQAGKVWDRAFATSWHEISPDHPSRAALERFVRAGWGGEDVRKFLATGEIDVTVGMPRSSRYQQAPEGNVQGHQPDFDQVERMHRATLTHPENTQPVAGSY